MDDFFLFRYWFEVGKMCSDDVALAFAARFKLLGESERAENFGNFKRYFAECVQNEYDAIKFLGSLKNFLKSRKPFFLPYEFSTPPLNSQTARSETVKGIIARMPPHWVLRQTTAKTSAWVENANARLHLKSSLFQLENTKTRTFIDFYLPDEKQAHILMFKVSAENESRFWIARSDFKEAFGIFTGAGFEKLTATILSIPSQHPMHVKEWRTDAVEIKGKQYSRLAAFWRRLGAIPDAENEKYNQGAVMFLAPELALAEKLRLTKQGKPNPYELLAKSVYPPDLENQLRDELK